MIFNKAIRLKVSDILILLFVIGMFLFVMDAKSLRPNNMSELIAQKQTWLRQTTQDIEEVMNDDDMKVWTASTGGRYVSIFSSPNYSTNRIDSLKERFIQKGWYLLPTQNYLNTKQAKTMSSELPLNNIYLLCKDGVALFIWKDNLKGEYESTTDISTKVVLEYHYITPCFNL